MAYRQPHTNVSNNRPIDAFSQVDPPARATKCVRLNLTSSLISNGIAGRCVLFQINPPQYWWLLGLIVRNDLIRGTS